MKIVKKRIDEIIPADYNPRMMSNKEKDKLKKSIEKFGYIEPIIWNKKTNHIVGGHQRYTILKEMGVQEIEVVEIDIDENQEKALNLALNKISGEWEENKLVKLLSDIEKNKEELLSFTGFDEKEINYLLNLIDIDYATEKEDKITIEDIDETNIKEGDLFEIEGKHRILCGDSSNLKNYKLLLGNQKIDLVVTSPPYNVNIKYSQYSDNKPFEDYLMMINKIFQAIKEYMNNYRFLCVNIGDQCKTNLSAHYSILLEKLGFTYSRTIYWVKPEAAARPTTTLRAPYPRWYLPQVNTETILLYINELEEERIEPFKVMITYSLGELSSKNRPDKQKTTPIDRELLKKYITNVWKMQPETRLSKNHPAPYPIQLPENCIRFYSLENEVVFDPFLGSGTTILAAEKLKRKGFGIELDPKYVELALRRYKQTHPEAKIKCLNRDLVV